MPIVIDPTTSHSFEYEDCQFRVCPLTGRQMLGLASSFSDKMDNPAVIYEVLHTALKSWEGVVDTGGKPLPCTPENIDALPVTAAAAIFEFVSNLSNASETDRGN